MARYVVKPNGRVPPFAWYPVPQPLGIHRRFLGVERAGLQIWPRPLGLAIPANPASPASPICSRVAPPAIQPAIQPARAHRWRNRFQTWASCNPFWAQSCLGPLVAQSFLDTWVTWIWLREPFVQKWLRGPRVQKCLSPTFHAQPVCLETVAPGLGCALEKRVVCFINPPCALDSLLAFCVKFEPPTQETPKSRERHEDTQKTPVGSNNLKTT